MKIKFKLNLNKKTSGNISILVIFVLLASSLIGVLTSNFVRQLLQYNNIILGHYKAYYLAKAGLELGLTEINNNGIGFENTIETGDDIIKSNINCPNCNFYLKIIGNSDYFPKSTNKDCSNPILIQTGKSIIIPLFTQDSMGSNYQKLIDKPKYKNITNNITDKIEIIDPKGNGDFTIGVFIISGGDLLEEGIYTKTTNINSDSINKFFKDFDNHALNITFLKDKLTNEYKKIDSPLKTFLLLGNSSVIGDPISLCIKINPIQHPPQRLILPTDYFYVQSVGNYYNKTIGLEAVSKQPIPSFLSHTYMGL